ncbi:queuosine precursor transporter [Legionella sp. D16C41]|uniref:queuosine precursor transporter n=1 Tax=Legionella sp. D16C41 TaxID=3402688 RepID=UPI003AF63460
MLDRTFNSNLLALKTNFLWFLTLTYTMIIVLANWFDPRLIKLFSLTTDAGTLVFPLTFLLSNLITEVYGYKHARRAIWCGFLFNVIFIIYGQIIIHLPGPDYPTNNAIFDTLLATNIRIIIASSLSYLSSEPLNSIVMAKLKIKMHGKLLSVRFLVSTLVAAGLDSFIFSFFAFYGVMSFAHLIDLILSMWFIKVSIEIIGLPLSIKLANRLKQIEKLDIYDTNTNFSLFSLDANYVNQDNKFKLNK